MAPASQDGASDNDPNDGQHRPVPLAALSGRRCRGVYGLTVAPVLRVVLRGKIQAHSSAWLV